MTVISGTGVIFLNPSRSLSRHVGRYLSKRIVRLAFSDCTLRLSIQLLTTLRADGEALGAGTTLLGLPGLPPLAEHPWCLYVVPAW